LPFAPFGALLGVLGLVFGGLGVWESFQMFCFKLKNQKFACFFSKDVVCFYYVLQPFQTFVKKLQT
jgi:uncharacterized membrane protein YsdA (DUF1294 family)